MDQSGRKDYSTMYIITDDEGNTYKDGSSRRSRMIQRAIAAKEAEFVSRISLNELRALDDSEV